MTKLAQSWALLLEAFQASLSVQNLALAAVGTFAITMVWAVLGFLLIPNDSDEARGIHHTLTSFTSTYNFTLAESAIDAPQPGRITEREWRQAIARQLQSSTPLHPVEAVATRLIEPVRQIFVTGNSWWKLMYLVFGSLATIAIWSFFGLAITRSTVLRCVGQKSIGFQAAIQFARQRWFDVFCAVTLPLLGMAMMSVPAIGLGWIMNWEVGFLVAGLAWVFVVLVSCLMSVLGIGILAGWPLMWGAISSENSDSFDAISRSYAYTFQRPLHYLFYVLVACVIGTFGWLVASIFAAMVVNFSFWIIEIGSGADQIEILQSLVSQSSKPNGTSDTLWTGAVMIRQVIRLVQCVASSYSFSFIWSTAAAFYLLLRRDTDQAEIDDVYVGSPESPE